MADAAGNSGEKGNETIAGFAGVSVPIAQSASLHLTDFTVDRRPLTEVAQCGGRCFQRLLDTATSRYLAHAPQHSCFLLRRPCPPWLPGSLSFFDFCISDSRVT